MPKRDDNQLKAENHVTNVSTDQRLRNLRSWQVAHSQLLHFLQSGLTGVFFTSRKRLLSGRTYFNPLHAFKPCHLQGQNLTTSRVCFCCVILQAWGTCSQSSFSHTDTDTHTHSTQILKEGREGGGSNMKTYMQSLCIATDKAWKWCTTRWRYIFERRMLFRTCSFGCLQGWNSAYCFIIY